MSFASSALTAATIFENLSKEYEEKKPALEDAVTAVCEFTLELDRYNEGLNSKHGHELPDISVLKRDSEGFTNRLQEYQVIYRTMRVFETTLCRARVDFDRRISPDTFDTIEWLSPDLRARVEELYHTSLRNHQRLILMCDHFTGRVALLHEKITHNNDHPQRQIRQRIQIIETGGDPSSALQQLYSRARRYVTYDTHVAPAPAPDHKQSAATVHLVDGHEEEAFEEPVVVASATERKDKEADALSDSHK